MLLTDASRPEAGKSGRARARETRGNTRKVMKIIKPGWFRGERASGTHACSLRVLHSACSLCSSTLALIARRLDTRAGARCHMEVVQIHYSVALRAGRSIRMAIHSRCEDFLGTRDRERGKKGRGGRRGMRTTGSLEITSVIIYRPTVLHYVAF